MALIWIGLKVDDADRAEERIEQVMDDALAEVRRAQERGPRAVGVCYYCREPLASGRLFCDADCRDGWEFEQKLKRMTGVA